METTDLPIQESVVHTMSEHADDNPHVILKADSDQSEYTRRIEERLAELERTVERLVLEKVKFAKSEAIIDESATTENSVDKNNKEEKKEEGTEEETEEGKEEGKEGEKEEDKQEDKQEDKDGEKEEEEEAAKPIVPKARKLNYINFVNRFPCQTEIPVVEALMVDSTVQAASGADYAWFADKEFDDYEQSMPTMLESNPMKSDAWMARIRINSASLVKEIMNILEPDMADCANLTFIHPFEPLVNSLYKFKEKLQEMQNVAQLKQDEAETAKIAEGAELLAMMEVFVRFVEEEVIPLFPKNRTKIRFASLSAIFELGETIYVPDTRLGSRPNPEALRDRRDQRLWRLYRTKRDFYEDSGSFMLKIYAIDHDGENYICQKKMIGIPAYEGEQEISSLPAFPLRYAENAEEIRCEARADGRKFVEYQKPQPLAHNGWGLDLDAGVEAPLHYVTSDVVVDMAEAIKSRSGWMPYGKFPKYSPGKREPGEYTIWTWRASKGSYSAKTTKIKYWLNEYSRLQKIAYCTDSDPFLSNRFKNPEKNYQLQEQDFELLPHRLFAYVLQDRRFLAVDIRNMRPVSDDETDAPSLVIDPKHESLLYALVRAHFQRKKLHEKHGMVGINQDIIANKGRGLIILLYGVPGVGKTSTAEKIAHSWKRPLLPITCGDLGTKAVDVENRLKDLFRLAQIWDCILLLDEAEVFLSERTPTSLERNALVSVFLRQIEYYTGIMFLTTNLPGGIDEAFKSRIHTSLYYPHLDEDTAMAIWDVNIKRLEKVEAKRAEMMEEPPLTIDFRGIKKFARRHFRNNVDGQGRWNGRQIRNAFLIASALAQFEKDKPPKPGLYPKDSAFDIKPRYFKVVADATLNFEQYLAETRGQTASEMMFQRGQRADFILPEQLAGLSSTAAYDTPTRRDKERLGAPSPIRGHQGRSASPAPHAQQSHVNVNMPELQLAHGGNLHGGHEGYTASTHQNKLFGSPQRDSRVTSSPNLGNTTQSLANARFQDLPSSLSSRQGRQAVYANGNADVDSDSDV